MKLEILTLIVGMLCFLSVGSIPSAQGQIRITVLYNNVSTKADLQIDWGFAAWIEVGDKTILFDTGAKGPILLSNMGKLGLDPKEVDLVVLSHAHWDHTGGLSDFLERNPKVTVYLLGVFPASLKKTVTDAGAQVVEVSGSQQICEGVYTTGEMGTAIPEQSLLVETDTGTAIITGCAHPGIVEITRKAKEVLTAPVAVILGGFHLLRMDEKQINEVIGELKTLGVSKVGPSHCTGDQAIRAFRKTWQEDFVESGCGAEIILFSSRKQ